MAYENTSVPVTRSQDSIRKLILSHGGSSVAFVSQPPLEGFEAQVFIEAKTYRIRIRAECKPKESKRRHRSWSGRPVKDNTEEAAKRVWRVLFFHLKSVFEAAETGVMEFSELMLPYIVMHDGRTISDCVLPQLDKAIAGKLERMLPAKGETQ